MKVKRLASLNNSVNKLDHHAVINILHGQDTHLPRVGPDRHAVAVKNQNTLRIATWDVRPLFQPG